jgi:hypothetical protein
MSLPEADTKMANHILPCLLKGVNYFIISKARKRRRLKTYSTHLSTARHHVMSLPEADTKMASLILPCLLKGVNYFLISKARKKRRLKTYLQTFPMPDIMS